MGIMLRVLGLAAFVAAARAAWVHHQDNQAVIRTDLMNECFAAGQAAERTRAAEEAATARVWTPNAFADPEVDRAWTDLARSSDADFFTWTADGPRPTEFEEPGGSGWTEHDDRYGGTSR